MTNATCFLLKYDSRYNDLVIVRYFATDTAAMLMIETNAKRNVIKAYILQPILPKGNASSRTCMIENGTPSKQERKSRTAMLRMKNVEDDSEKKFLQITKMMKPLRRIPAEQVVICMLRKTVLQKSRLSAMVRSLGVLKLLSDCLKLFMALHFINETRGCFFRYPSENMVGKSWTGGRYFENAKYRFLAGFTTERAFCLLVLFLSPKRL